MSEKRRVVVTGLGMVTPLGLNEDALWSRTMEGRTGIDQFKAFDTEPYRTKIAAEVDSEALAEAMTTLGLRPMDRTVDMALVAAAHALRAAGVRGGDDETPLHAGAVFGTGHGCSHSTYHAFMSFAEKGFRGIRPTTIPRCMANAISGQVSLRNKLTGPNYVITCACSSASTAIGQAFRMVRDGYIDSFLCGGSDSPLDPGMFGCWNRLGVMSKRPDPATACRPFDTDRDGCVLGEGAGALFIETLESARARGARIRAELLGYGESSDATHITSPTPEGQANAIRRAITDAGINADRIAYVNAHGTATRANDTSEAASVRLALGDAADTAWVSSSKSFFGHTLGASGVLETIVTILALEQRTVPPNLNLDQPEDGCTLRLAGKQPVTMDGTIAMKNSFGFGGHNAVLTLSRWDNDA